MIYTFYFLVSRQNEARPFPDVGGESRGVRVITELQVEALQLTTLSHSFWAIHLVKALSFCFGTKSISLKEKSTYWI